MKNHIYHFKTTWELKAPVDVVWKVLLDVNTWPSWWKGLKKIRAIKTDGKKKWVCTIGWLFYTLTLRISFDEVIPEKRIHILAEGDVVGTGEFLLEPQENTIITFHWRVRTIKLWMNILQPVLKSIFIKAHFVTMKWFAEGMAKTLKAELVNIKHCYNP